MDILENSITARATKVIVKVTMRTGKEEMVLTIIDNGLGMDAETAARALDPFFTTKTGKKTGLGLSLLKQAAEQCGGEMILTSGKGSGTRIRALFCTGHPDMKPIGDMAGTIDLLSMAHPEISFEYKYEMED
jgi:signal transduction histidine kinase